MSPLLTIAATAVSAETKNVYTIQHSTGSFPKLSLARCAAAQVTARVGHGIQIYKNGKVCDYKRY